MLGQDRSLSTLTVVWFLRRDSPAPAPFGRALSRWSSSRRNSWGSLKLSSLAWLSSRPERRHPVRWRSCSSWSRRPRPPRGSSPPPPQAEHSSAGRWRPCQICRWNIFKIFQIKGVFGWSVEVGGWESGITSSISIFSWEKEEPGDDTADLWKISNSTFLHFKGWIFGEFLNRKLWRTKSPLREERNRGARLQQRLTVLCWKASFLPSRWFLISIYPGPPETGEWIENF